MQRLNDSRFGDKDVSDIRHYIKLGKLGRAFTSKEQVVLLIDEIDKADLEFPNDLLNELDEMSFYIPEIDETVHRQPSPHNNHHQQCRERATRCLSCAAVYSITSSFPTQELMEEIVQVHFPDIKNNLMHKAISAFYKLREIDAFRKKPSTSELLDWIQALIAGGISPDRIQNEIPFIGTLLKKETDYDYFIL